MQSASSDARSSNARKGWPIVAYLVFGVSGLVFLSVAGVLLVTLSIATRNTFELLEDKSRLLMTSLGQQIGQFLQPLQAQVNLLGDLIEDGEIDPRQPERLFEALRASLAASPQMRSTVFLDPSGWMMAAIRGDGGIEPAVDDWRLHPDVALAMKEAEATEGSLPFWGPPVFVPGPDVTVLNLRRSIIREGQFLGLIATTLTVGDLSRFITSLETETGQNAFILYDRDLVLAHSALALQFPGLSRNEPLPRVTEIGDPVLFNIWRDGWQNRKLEFDVNGHSGELGGTEYIYLYQGLAGVGDQPWLVGSYFRSDAVTGQLDRLLVALGLGLLALVVAMIVALLLGRRVSRPVTQLAVAADSIRTLDLEDLAPLRRSRLREIDAAAIAFNAMVRTLRVFTAYVPKQVVQGLIRHGIAASLASSNREVTVLFTDIVGFTARTEALSAEETAEFLNHHFELLTGCIEADGGTVDKYVGDGIMALWNALDDQPDHPTRGARAARRMAEAIRGDATNSDPPVRLRIGMHTGRAVVGNVGTRTRMNFTAVGSTVNTAQRLQALGAELAPNADVVVVLSAATAAGLPSDLAIESLGHHRLRGQSQPAEVFQLVL
jgi:adenylate cyclase